MSLLDENSVNGIKVELHASIFNSAFSFEPIPIRNVKIIGLFINCSSFFFKIHKPLNTFAIELFYIGYCSFNDLLQVLQFCSFFSFLSGT